MAAPGRREAHKRATRAALTEAARALFAERGYDQVTVRDIAEAAEVTERTFFRYFASKDDLIYAEVLDLLPAFHRAVVDQPAELSPLAAVRAALLGMSWREPGLGLLFSGPPRRRHARVRPAGALLLNVEAGLADALAERLAPTGAPRLHAEVLARAAVAALRSCLITYHLAGGPGAASLDTIRGLITEALTLLDSTAAPTTPA